MSILNTFWLLYKSNSDDVIKGNKAVEKSTKETARALKNTDEEANKLGQSFVKMVENAAGAAGAYVGFAALKNGILQSAEYNKNLTLTGKLLNVNAQQMDTFARAAQSAGGSVAGAMSDIQNIAQSYVSVGLPVPDMQRRADYYRNLMRGMTPGQKRITLQNAGYNDPGLQSVLMSSDSEYAASMTASKSTLSPSQSSAALNFQKNKTKVEKAATGAFSTLTEAMDPAITWAADKLTQLLNWAGASKKNSLVAGGLGVGATATGGWGIVRLARMLFGGASVAGTAAAAGIAGAGAAGYAWGGNNADSILQFIDKIKDRWNNWTPKSGSLTESLKKGGDLGFWTGRGYSPAQAAAIMANVQAESGGDPAAVGDGGKARGLFQWHPDRRAAILKGTGIDVTTAGYQAQLQAAAWEMQNGRPGFDDKYFRTLNDPAAAAGYFSDKFESPADRVGQMMRRGKSALAIASQFPASSKGDVAVNIENLTIHTQATNATEIAENLSNELYSQLSIVQANHDDGINR